MLLSKIRAKPSRLGIIVIFILGAALGVWGLQHDIPQKINNRLAQHIEKNRDFSSQELAKDNERVSQNGEENVHDKATFKASPDTGFDQNPEQHAALAEEGMAGSNGLSDNPEPQGVLADVSLSETTDVEIDADVGEDDLSAASNGKNEGCSTPLTKGASEFSESIPKRLEFDEKRAQQIKEVFVLRMEAMEYLECER